MGISMSGVRSSHPSLPAIQLDPALTRQHYRDWSHSDASTGGLQSSELARRGINLLLALIALVVAMPVMILVGLLVWLTSRGPVLYTQVRVGLDRRSSSGGAQNHRRQHDMGGQPFTIYKFRTMRVDAENGSGAVWAQ